MPLVQPVENVLGLKTLIYDSRTQRFVSPAHGTKDGDRFTWSRAGLVAAQCDHCSKDEMPGKDCSCGLYATYSYDIAQSYGDWANGKPVMLLVEASGRTALHSEGYRSAEMTVVLAIKPPDAGGLVQAAVDMAADYFQVQTAPSEDAIAVMDIVNVTLMDYYKPTLPAFRMVPREQLVAVGNKYLRKVREV